MNRHICFSVTNRASLKNKAPQPLSPSASEPPPEPVPEDDEEVIIAGEPRRVHHFEIVFGAHKVRTPHDEALGMMGPFGRDVQLASSVGPPKGSGAGIHAPSVWCACA